MFKKICLLFILIVFYSVTSWCDQNQLENITKLTNQFQQENESIPLIGPFGDTILGLPDFQWLTVSPDGRYAAGVHNIDGIHIWNLETGDFINNLANFESEQEVRSIFGNVIFLDNERIVSKTKVMNIFSGEVLGELEQRDGAISHFYRLSDNGKTFAGTIGENFSVWDAETLDLLFDKRFLGMKHIRFDNVTDNWQVITKSNSGQVNVIDAESGNIVETRSTQIEDGIFYSPSHDLIITAFKPDFSIPLYEYEFYSFDDNKSKLKIEVEQIPMKNQFVDIIEFS